MHTGSDKWSTRNIWLSLSATPNDTTDLEGDYDPTDNTLDLPELGEALEQPLSENLSRQHSQQTASLVTPEARTPDEPLSPETPKPTRMEGQPGSSGKGKKTPKKSTTKFIALTEEQFSTLLERVTPVNRVRGREPDVFNGERSKLRGFLVQLKNYFSWQGWDDDHNLRIHFAKQLFREGAEKWITPYIEGRIKETWNTWEECEQVLKEQFGDIDSKEAARNKLERMRQRTMTMTDYWNEF